MMLQFLFISCTPIDTLRKNASSHHAMTKSYIYVDQRPATYTRLLRLCWLDEKEVLSDSSECSPHALSIVIPSSSHRHPIVVTSSFHFSSFPWTSAPLAPPAVDFMHSICEFRLWAMLLLQVLLREIEPEKRTRLQTSIKVRVYVKRGVYSAYNRSIVRHSRNGDGYAAVQQ